VTAPSPTDKQGRRLAEEWMARSIAITYRWAGGTPVAELHEYDDGGLIERLQALYVGLSW
jgi:hypothetical protein